MNTFLLFYLVLSTLITIGIVMARTKREYDFKAHEQIICVILSAFYLPIQLGIWLTAYIHKYLNN